MTAGAVSSKGQPYRSYCKNTGDANGRFPWWAACCEWKHGKCVPKEMGNNILVSYNTSKIIT